VRQTERHITEDPPAERELAAVAGEVAAVFEAEVPTEVRRAAATGIAVAGTPTSLASVDQRLDPYDRDRVDGYRLDRHAVEEILEHMAKLPLEERREIVGLNPARAPTIVAGAIILLEAMRAFDLGWIETSEADILHGVALDATTRE
jgi:exopolyphosphatase/guanosine-5'-triphosphate,3'-diphosphate pyrophosphatase